MRYKKLLSMLLVLAMVMTNFTIPVMAAEVAESIQEIEAETATTSEAITDDTVVETAASSEAITDATVEETATTSEEIADVTVEETADTSEEITDVTVEEANDTSDKTSDGFVEEEIPEENITINPNDFYYIVTSYDELYAAISKINAKQPNGQVKIEIKKVSQVTGGIDLGEDNNFVIPVSANKITINSGVDIIIDNKAGAASEFVLKRDEVTNALLTNSALLTIDSGAKLTLDGVYMQMNIVNKGTLKATNSMVSPISGSALENRGIAVVNGCTFYVNDYENSEEIITPTDIVINNGTMTINGISTSVKKAFKTPAEGENTLVFGIKNTKNLVMQSYRNAVPDYGCEDVTNDSAIPSNTRYYALGNIGSIAKAEIRSEYNETILNDSGKLTVGEENTEAENTDSGDDVDTVVGTIYTIRGGLAVIHDAIVERIVTFTTYTNDATEGRVSVVGNYANVADIYTRDASKLQITNGYVGNSGDVYYTEDFVYAVGLPFSDPMPGPVTNVPIVVLKPVKGGAAYTFETDSSKYVFKNPYNTSLARVKDGKTEYAYGILNGVPLFGDEFSKEETEKHEITDISNLEQLKEFATKGGYGRLISNVTVNEVVTFSAEEFVLLEDGLSDNYHLTFAGTGAFVVAETVKNGEIYEKIQTDNSATPILNNGVLKLGAGVTINQAADATKEGGSAINNSGTLELAGSFRYTVSAGSVKTKLRDININANAEKSVAIDNSGKLSVADISTDELDNKYYIRINAQKENTTAILNSGRLNLEGKYIHTDNPEVVGGNHNFLYVMIAADKAGSKGIYNTGEAALNKYVEVYAKASTSYATTGIYNKGDLEIKGASVFADKAKKYDHDSDPSTPSIYRTDGWAIVYEGDRLPVIYDDGINSDSYPWAGSSEASAKVLNEIQGSRYEGDANSWTVIDTLVEGTQFEDFNNRVYGSAIAAFDGVNYSIGSFIRGIDRSVIDSIASGVIYDGYVAYSGVIKINNGYNYLLMERGEIVQNEKMYRNPADSDADTLGCVEDSIWATSANNNLVTLGKMKKKEIDSTAYTGAEGEKEVSTITAGDKDGICVVSFYNKVTKQKDSLVIEITQSREKLVADSYQVNLARSVETVNAYKRDTKIAIDWRLKTSDLTGKEYDPADTFMPKEVVITGSSPEQTELFREYFTVSNLTEDTTNTKEWTFNLTAQTEVADSVPSYKTEVTRLLQDGIKSLDNLNVTLIVGNTASNKTFAIDAGTLCIKVDYKKPVVKFNALTLNSAYRPSAYYTFNGRKEYPAQIITKEDAGNKTGAELQTLLAANCDYTIDNATFSGNYKTEDFEIEYYKGAYNSYYIPRINYIGAVKNRSVKLPISVHLKGYIGYYETTLPINIKATYPKVSLTTKKLIIPENAGDYYNIPIGISAKTIESLGTVKSVSVIGSDDFVIAGSVPKVLYTSNNAIFAKNGKVSGYKSADGDLYLQPQKAVKEKTKLKLLVTFDGLKAKNGKNYTQTLSLTVSPVSKDKFKFKADAKKSQALKVVLNGYDLIDREKSNYQATIKLAMSPSNFKGGYITVSSNDNKLSVVSVNRMEKSFVVKAGPALTGTDKSADVCVNWYAADGTHLGEDNTIITVKVKPVADIKGVLIKDVNLNIAKAKPKNYDELENIISSGVVGDDHDYRLSYDTAWIKLYGQKLVVTNPEKYEFDGDALMDNVYRYAESGLFNVVQMNNALYVVPKKDALIAGKIVPGGEYSVSVPFIGISDANFKVTVNWIKNVKSVLVADTPANISGITSYARTDKLCIETVNPWYGVGIISAEIAENNCPFEIISYLYNGEISRTARDNSLYFRLAYKEGKIPAKLAKSYKVKLNVVYTNGATGVVTIPVKIK